MRKAHGQTAEDARKMVEAAKRTGKKLTIGYQGRHRPIHSIKEYG